MKNVVLKPVGNKCNIQCHYCYQNPERDAGNGVVHTYDIEKMKEAITAEAGEGDLFTIWGGEALMVPENDLEELWSWGFEKYGRNAIQTNGLLINDSHIKFFKKYKVRVGISIDGPGELNDARWAGSLQRTRDATAKILNAIDRLLSEGVTPSLIVSLTRCNATRDRLPVMRDWFKDLEAKGITAVRLHNLKVDYDFIRNRYALSTEENLEAFLSFLDLQETELSALKFDVFEDMKKLLLGKDDECGCVWMACDPYTTEAVPGVNGHGHRSNCDMVNVDGIDFIKSPAEGYERYLALYNTPQEYGGCAECRFFLMCKGQCPGDAIDGDWRNRSESCEFWKSLFGHLEKLLADKGLDPVSLRPYRQNVETIMVYGWARGRNLTIARSINRLTTDSMVTN